MKDKYMNEALLEKKLGIEFNDKSLLALALTHSSYKREHPDVASNNERLEFMGDGILDAVIAITLYGMLLDKPEGMLTKTRALIVCEKSLSEIARSFGIGDHLYLGHGEIVTGGRDKDSILADALEAIIGAVFLDKDEVEVTHFIRKIFKETIDSAIEGKLFNDYKSQLQELLQAQYGPIDIDYILDMEEGPSHRKNFFIHVEVNGQRYGDGAGSSKKEAEQQAAQATLELLER